MAIPEAQLEIWSRQGAMTTSKATADQIKAVLKSANSPFADRDFEVYLQGSYLNDTNVFRESDVDIVIQLSAFQYSLDALPMEQKAAFRQVFNGGVTYDLPEFKRDVLAHLEARYDPFVDPGEKAINILPDGNRRSADVIVCLGYRNYEYFVDRNVNDYARGIWFKDDGGTKIINYPKLHSQALTDKHQDTRSWLKPTIRIFKNMRNRMIADGYLEEGDAPSYFVEGMIWNVPTSEFGGDYEDTVRNCLVWLSAANRGSLVCPNGQYYLLAGDSPVTWSEEKYNAFVAALIEYWNDWS